MQVTPNLTVSPGGRVDAVWWDFRNDNGAFANDWYYSYSTDNGTTWTPNICLTEQSVNRHIGVWSNGFDIRQPPGIASTNAVTVMAWDDTRLGDQVSQTQDIFTRVVQFEAIGGGTSNTALYVIGGLIGLAAVGVILLIVALISGRRPGGAASGAPKPKTVEAKA